MRSNPRALPTLLALSLLSAAGACAPQQAGTASAEKVDAPVAVVAGEPISRAELEREELGGLRRIDYDRYRLLDGALTRMIEERLLDTEAKARGIDRETLLAQEVDAKVAEPTEEDIARFFQENQGRSGGRDLSQWSERIRTKLRSDRAVARRAELIEELEAKLGVTRSLDPPRYDVSLDADDHVRGPETAPVTIVEYGDFQCPYCRSEHTIVQRLLGEYGDRLRYTFRDFPLANHDRAVPTSLAARCAADQGKYWDYFDHLMVMRGTLNDDDLLQRATDLGLDAERFETCYESKQFAELIQDKTDSGAALGVSATPTFFINGRILVGAKVYEELKAVVDAELARAGGASEAAPGA